MKEGTWNRLKDVLGRALELPLEERETFVERECAGDDALRKDVAELLAAHKDAAGRMEDPEGPGASIGPYKLLQRIGEGGFGVVYMAEQKEPIRRRVALKIIKLGMDTKQVIARFEAERQALAMMDHPGIARVLDAGATETGRPYFVMELVGGIPITEFCDQNHFDTDQRLELFLQVCRAVQHAHQKGIIHRDLKPTNVLVAMHDGRPLCKIIDFGISKATSGVLTDKTLFTEFRQFIGTPQYMSPEQATLGGLDVDTRSDIYSLGVLLYELLTGEPPLDGQRLCQAALDEMKRIITEEEPLRPSARVSTRGEALVTLARNRSQEPAALVRSLRGDLDWVVLKALEKDRGRRYATANELAADIERHRSHEPVTALPPTLAYRARKFVRRNRGPVLAGAALALMLVLGIAATAVALVEARAGRELAAEEARKRGAVAEFLAGVLDTAATPSGRGPDGQISVLNLLDEAAAQLESSVLADDPVSYARVAGALSKAYGTQRSAERSVEMAVRALKVLGDGSRDPLLYAAAARIVIRLGAGGVWGQRERQRALYLRAMELLEPGLQGRDPKVLWELYRWSCMLPEWDPDEGERIAVRLKGMVEAMQQPPFAPVLVELSLADTYFVQGRTQDARRGYQLAREQLLGHLVRNEVDVLVEAVVRHQGDSELFLDAIGLETVSRIAERIRDAGPKDFQTALAMRDLAGELPWPDHGDDLLLCGEQFVQMSDPGLAESLFRASLSILQDTVADDHPALVASLFGVASTIGRDRFEEKVATFREAIRLSDLNRPVDVELYCDFAYYLLLEIREIGITDPEADDLLREAESLAERSFEEAQRTHLVDQQRIWPLFSLWNAVQLLKEAYAKLDEIAPDAGHDAAYRRWRDRHHGLLPEMIARAERPEAMTGLMHGMAWTLLTLEPPEDRDPESARRVVERARNVPAHLHVLAMAELQCGDLQHAIELQREAVSLIPEDNELGRPFREKLAEYEAALRDRNW